MRLHPGRRIAFPIVCLVVLGSMQGCDPVVRSSTVESHPLRGGFVPVPALVAIQSDPDVMRGPPSQPTAGLVADIDGDGIPDFVDNRGEASLAIYLHRADGTWTPVEGLPEYLRECIVAADLDADGSTDLVCVEPHVQVFWGRSGRMYDWSQPTIVADHFAAGAITVWDIDEDGLSDLLVSRSERPQEIYRNVGRRSFESVADRWGVAISSLNFVSTLSDIDGDGRDDLLYQNDGTHKTNDVFLRTGEDSQGDPIFTLRTPEPRVDRPSLLTSESYNPMGSAALDFDGDGTEELFFAVSVENSLLRWRDHRWHEEIRAMNLPVTTTSEGRYAVYWSPALWDVDHDDRVDIVVPTGDGLGEATMPGRGSSRMLFAHAVPGGYEDVRDQVGLGEWGQYMTLSLDDFDLDGDLDLALGGNAQRVRLFENRVEPAGRHVIVRLHGTVSETAGRGARVSTTSRERPQEWRVGARFPLKGGGSPLVDLALPDAPTDVRVDWPSGYRQLVRNVGSAPYLDVTEPAFVTIDPPSRHAPADGSSVVTIRVRPVDPDGAALDAQVSVELGSGDATWLGPATLDATGASTRTIQAPSVPGSVTLRITIAGRTVSVRPRIWFD